jgi:hypothetical protein
MNWSPSPVQMKWTGQHLQFRWNELVTISSSDEMSWSTSLVQMKWTGQHLSFIWAWTEDPGSHEILNLNCHMPNRYARRKNQNLFCHRAIELSSRMSCKQDGKIYILKPAVTFVTSMIMQWCLVFWFIK